MGHQTIIDNMLELHGEDVLLMIGSCNSMLSDRIPFSYSDRKRFILNVYPHIQLVGLPDFSHIEQDPTFATWHSNLWDIIDLKWNGCSKEDVVFYGGSYTDLSWAIESNYSTVIINRSKLLISGTIVREYLFDGKDISEFIDYRNKQLVIDAFNKNY